MFTKCQCVRDCEELQINRETTEKLETETKSSKGKNPASNRQGNKASAATQTSQLVANQPARPLSSQTVAGSRNWPSREIEKERDIQREKEREREFSLHKNTYPPSPHSPSCFIQPQRDTVGKGDRHR